MPEQAAENPARRRRIPAEERRAQVIQAALRLFAARGYDGTTTRDIAEAVGVAEGLLFRHFATKHEILRAAIHEYGPRAQLRQLAPRMADLPLRDALILIYSRLVDLLWEHRDFVWLVMTESQKPGEARDEFRTLMEEGPRFMAGFLRDRIERGELRALDAEVAAALLGGAIFCYYLRQRCRPVEEGRRLCRAFVVECVDLFLRGAQAETASAGGEAARARPAPGEECLA